MLDISKCNKFNLNTILYLFEIDMQMHYAI